MIIDVEYTLGELDDSLKTNIERRLILALSKVEPHIISIIVVLSNVNKNDVYSKRCSLSISLNGISDILIEETQKDLNTAIDRVIQKATRIVFRKILLINNEGL